MVFWKVSRVWNWQNPLEEPSSNWWPSRSLSWCPHDGRRTCALGPQLWGSESDPALSMLLKNGRCWCGRRGCSVRTAWRAWLLSQMLFRQLSERQTVLGRMKPDFQFLQLLFIAGERQRGILNCKDLHNHQAFSVLRRATLKNRVLPRLLSYSKSWMSEK